MLECKQRCNTSLLESPSKRYRNLGPHSLNASDLIRFLLPRARFQDFQSHWAREQWVFPLTHKRRGNMWNAWSSIFASLPPRTLGKCNCFPLGVGQPNPNLRWSRPAGGPAQHPMQLRTYQKPPLWVLWICAHELRKPCSPIGGHATWGCSLGCSLTAG